MKIMLPLAIVALLLLAACGAKQLDDETVAIVGDKAITREMLENELSLIPPYQRDAFSSLEGKRSLLSHMIERELLLMAAYDADLDQDSFVVERVETATQQLKDIRKRSLIQAYYENFVVNAVEIPEEEIVAYYNEHVEDMFHQDAQVRVSHVLVSTDEDKIEVALMIEQGIPFDSIVVSMSEHLATVSEGGDIGWVTMNMPMPYLGEQAEITRTLFETQPGNIAGPFETELGSHWFKITEVKEEGTVPLEEVRSNIETMIRPALVNSYFKDELIPRLHEDYNVIVQNLDDSPVIALIGEFEITRDMLDTELQTIPPYQRANFESPEGREILLGHIIERELLFQAAQDSGLDEDSFVVAQLELGETEVDRTMDMAMIQLYYERYVVEAVEIPEADIEEYYNSHINDIYHQDAQIRVSHILAENEAELDEIAQLLEQGISFDSVAIQLSRHDLTSGLGGDLGWITLNSPLPYIGSVPVITEELQSLDIGSVIGPRETDLGYHYFMVTDRVEEGSKPLEEARESIISALRPGLVSGFLYDTVFPSLEEKYGVEINEDAFLPDESVPADSLMQMAQDLMGTDPAAAIQYFELFLRRFPDTEKTDQAQFLIGFTYSEQIGDYAAAKEAFAVVVSDYPESELADDAQWMIENMETPIEDFLPVEEVPEVEPGIL